MLWRYRYALVVRIRGFSDMIPVADRPVRLSIGFLDVCLPSKLNAQKARFSLFTLRGVGIRLCPAVDRTCDGVELDRLNKFVT